MSTTLILIISALYGMTAISMYMQGQIGLALMFLFYALANFGVILASRGI